VITDPFSEWKVIMLYEALFLSAVILVVVNLGFRSRKWGIWVAFGCVAISLFGSALFHQPLFGPFWLRPRFELIFQTILLALLVEWGTRRAWKGRFFLKLSIVATLPFFAIFLLEPFFYDHEIARLRDQFAFESLEGRLPLPKRSPGLRDLPKTT